MNCGIVISYKVMAIKVLVSVLLCLLSISGISCTSGGLLVSYHSVINHIETQWLRMIALIIIHQFMC